MLLFALEASRVRRAGAGSRKGKGKRERNVPDVSTISTWVASRLLVKVVWSEAWEMGSAIVRIRMGAGRGVCDDERWGGGWKGSILDR